MAMRCLKPEHRDLCRTWHADKADAPREGGDGDRAGCALSQGDGRRVEVDAGSAGGVLPNGDIAELIIPVCWKPFGTNSGKESLMATDKDNEQSQGGDALERPDTHGKTFADVLDGILTTPARLLSFIGSAPESDRTAIFSPPS
jgi:hypothetical protein